MRFAPLGGCVRRLGNHNLAIVQFLHQHSLHGVRMDIALNVQNDFFHHSSPPSKSTILILQYLLYGFFWHLSLALVPVTEEKSRFFQRFLPFGREKPLDRTAKGFSFAYSSFKVITMSLFSMAVATSASLLSKPLFSTISSRFQRTPFLEMPSLSAIS